jgi:hypothetical protein
MNEARLNVRECFAKLDADLLLDPIDVAEILRTTPAGVSRMKLAGELPLPLVQKNRITRWSVGQLREYLASLKATPVSKPHPGRRGRPRTQTEGVLA